MKWVLIGLGGLLLLAVAGLAALPYLVNAPKIQATIAHSASQALGRPVTFSSLSLALFPLPALRLTDLTVAEDPKFGTAAFLTIERGRMALRLWPLLRGRVEVTELTLERPKVALIQEPGGQWNIAGLGAHPGGAPAPAPKGSGGQPGLSSLPLVSRVRVTDGALRYEVRSKQGAPIEYRLEGLNLTVSGVGLGAPIEFHGETRLVPGDLWIKIANGSLSLAVGHPLAESALSGDVEVSAKDIATLIRALLGPTPPLAGPVQGKLALSGTLAGLAARGELTLSRLRVTGYRPQCPEPKTRSLALEAVRVPLSYTPSHLTSRPLSARLGGGTATVALNFDFAPRPFLRLSEISIKALPLAPVLVDYLCQGYAVSGPLDLTGELAARPGDPWRTLAGEGQFKIGAGRVVGPLALALLSGVVRTGSSLVSVLNLELPQALFASPLEFDSITGSYRIVDGRLTTQDFLYSSSRMKVAAAGDYWLTDGRMNLDLAMSSGRGKIRARVTGSANSPSIQVRAPTTILETGPERLRGLFRGLPGSSP
jgi:hypothetical protein